MNDELRKVPLGRISRRTLQTTGGTYFHSDALGDVQRQLTTLLARQDQILHELRALAARMPKSRRRGKRKARG